MEKYRSNNEVDFFCVVASDCPTSESIIQHTCPVHADIVGATWYNTAGSIGWSACTKCVTLHARGGQLVYAGQESFMSK